MVNFIELPNEILIKIVSLTDLNSKLNLMLTDKNFYNLIGKNSKLCENFHLKVKWDSYPPELVNNGRIFRSITIKGCFEIHMEDNFAGLLELLTDIGVYVKELKILECKIKRNQFYQLLSLIPNVQEVTIDFLEFIFKDLEELPVVNHGFKKLKTLFLYSKVEWEYGQIFSDVFKDVKTLEELDLNESFNLISKNPKLKDLTLSRYHKPTDFNVQLEDEILQLEDLKIDCFPLKDGEATENFIKFIKTQNMVKNFYFEDRRERIGESSLILNHILKLDSLRSVEIHAKIGEVLNQFQSNQIKNFAVKELTIREKVNSSITLFQYFFVFPRITSLQIHPETLTEENVLLINNLKTLEELYIDGQHLYILCKVAETILEKIQIENLKKFKLCASLVEKYPSKNFKILVENNPNLTELTIKMKYWIGLESVKTILQNLKKLKKLVINGICDNNFKLSDKIFEVIGENGQSLEFFELDLECCDKEATRKFKESAISYFSKYLPHLKCDFGDYCK